MATSFHSFVDRENISNSVIKNSVSKGIKEAQGPARLSAKTFHNGKYPQATPRKVFGDLGNLQHDTGRKFQTPKPSTVKIFEDTTRPNQRRSTKVKKGTFSVLRDRKVDSKLGESQAKQSSENNLPEIEKMTPFIDQENDLATPQYIKRLLQHPRILNPSSIMPPKEYVIDNDHITSELDFDTVRHPTFDDTMANIVGYDDKLEFCEVEDNLSFLDDIPLDMPLPP